MDYFTNFLRLSPQGKIDQSQIRLLSPTLALHSGVYSFTLEEEGKLRIVQVTTTTPRLSTHGPQISTQMIACMSLPALFALCMPWLVGLCQAAAHVLILLQLCHRYAWLCTLASITSSAMHVYMPRMDPSRQQISLADIVMMGCCDCMTAASSCTTVLLLLSCCCCCCHHRLASLFCTKR